MLRLTVAILLVLVSLLVVFRAPTHFLWLVAVAITGYPYILMLLSLLPIVFSLHQEKYRLLICGCCTVAFVLYSLPLVAAYQQCRKLPSQLSAIFPHADTEGQLPQPFSLLTMFKGIGDKERAYIPIVYSRDEQTTLSLDYYPSLVSGKRPIVIVVHGGSWQSGDSRQLPALNSYLSAKGYNIAAINYRLAPDFKSPAAVDDTKAAVAFLVKHSEELHIDTGNIVLLGRSAGAQIALVAAYELGNQRIRGVVSFYGPEDMVWGGQVKMNKWVLNTDEIYNNYFGGVYEQVPGKFRESSACEYVTPSAPPTLIIHGKIDPLVAFEHGYHLQERLNEVHVPNYFLQLPFATHGCDFNINGPDGQVTTYAVERFMHSITTQETWKK